MKNKFMLAGLILVLLLGAASFKYKPSRSWLEEVDYNHFHGALFRLLGKDYGDYESDLTLYERFLPRANFEWLKPGDIYIAHALGGKYDAHQNSSLALWDALENGFTYFEVDIYKSADGQVVCGPVGGVSVEGSKNLCNLDWLIEVINTYDIYMILDIKSDFRSTIQSIEEKVRGSDVGMKLIPQIYSFNQLTHVDLSIFAGPLFTAYRSNRPVTSLLKAASKFGMPAITLSSSSIFSLNNELLRGYRPRVFTHGIDSAEMVSAHEQIGVTGFYLSNKVMSKLVQK